MKRLLLAATLAIGVHMALFSIQFQWTPPSLLMPQSRSVSISLVAAPPAPTPAPKVLPPPEKKTKPKPEPKPKPNPVKAPEPVAVTEPAPELEPLPEIETVEPEPEKAEAAPLFDEPQATQLPSAPEGAVIQSSVPRYDINPEPRYPSVARRRGYEGTVKLDVLVTREGRVGQIKVVQSSGYTILDRRALATVGKWIFTPALRGTETIEMWVEVPITFQLE